MLAMNLPTEEGTPEDAFPRKRKFPLSVEEMPDAFAQEVRSCRGAARARNIHPHEELKSILFRSEDLFVMAHLLGDMMVDERRLKDVIRRAIELIPGQLLVTDAKSLLDRIAEDLKIVPRDDLGLQGLEKGRVNPLTTEEYLGSQVQHVICSSVVDSGLPFVYTNNDTLTGTIRTRPRNLVHRIPGAIYQYYISRPKKVKAIASIELTVDMNSVSDTGESSNIP
jgi:hypothetical protein